MKNVKVSVIVPIYNVEEYLPKCVLSIQNQSYGNLEIILVDDGSPDKCGDICEEYKLKDERIKVVHKPNGGLSDARNAGMEVATGEYYVFIDSDDYIHPQMIEKLIEARDKTGADIVVSGLKYVGENENVDYETIGNVHITEIVSDEDRILYFYEKKYVEFVVAWNKLYPADYFENIKYPKGKIHEDEFTTYKLLEKADKIAFIDIPLYFYVQRKNSITGTGFNIKRLLVLDALEEKINHYLDLKKYKWVEKNLFLYRMYLIKYSREIDNSSNIKSGQMDKYFKFYKRVVLSSIFKTSISFKNKIGYIMMIFFPKQYMKNKYN